MSVFMTHETAPDLRLGLIGDNIKASRSPILHRLAGRQHDMKVSYELLIPKELGLEFDALFAACAEGGPFRAINVTYPYKERAAKKVSIDDPLVKAMGAVNTVVFTEGGAKGFNTDYTGFVSAYQGVRGEAAPGAVCMIGTGGVGRAVAFGLIKLGATEIRLCDRDLPKADAVAAELREVKPGLIVSTFSKAEEAAAGADGIINCTPVGMVGYEGSPIEAAALQGASWCFDAVYTPVDTQFLGDCAAAGLSVISGYELFFYQGYHAWTHFTGLGLSEPRLREDLIKGEDA